VTLTFLYYLSISPKTISCVPIIVTRSANIKSLLIISKLCKCKNPGALILHLYGRDVLLDTKKTPNSPLGASTTAYASPFSTTKPSLYS